MSMAISWRARPFATVCFTLRALFGLVCIDKRHDEYQHGRMTMAENPTAAQFDAFRAMYDYFNCALFAGVLRPVILNFSRAANSLGFFAPMRWERGTATTHEISLNPAYLKHRDARDIASTLVHEQVHCWQQEHGRPGRRGYHNEEWAAKMESIGLMPSATAAPGGARVGYQMSHYVIEGGRFAISFAAMPAEHTLPWTCWEGGHERKPRAASKVKFSCAACGANAWGRPSLRLVCGDCELAMEADGATDGSAACAA